VGDSAILVQTAGRSRPAAPLHVARSALVVVALLIWNVVAAVPAASAAAPPPHGKAKTVPGVVLVGYQPGTPLSDRSAARRSVHAARARALSPLARSAERIDLPKGTSVDAAIAALRRDPNVRFAEPDYVLRTDAVSNDPGVTGGNLWGMESGTSSPSNAFGTGAMDAWAAGHTGSRDVVVGVVDEGIQIDHPDLAANIWTNPWEVVNGIDDDGNGYVDDIHGWDFLHDDNTVYDGPTLDGHGTHVAGTIGGVGGNAVGVAGVNWAVSLISAKFLEGTGDTADAIRALDYLTDLKVRHNLNIVATNNSWGGGEFSQALLDAINRGGDQGILFVAAAGNDGADDDGLTPFYPAASACTQHFPSNAPRGWDCIVSVAAIDDHGHLASFSNYGSTTVDLGAPGEGIVSTYTPASYAIADGTSMAAPHVTGALALLADCNGALLPSQLRADVLATGASTASLGGKTVTGKRLDIEALTAAHCDASGPPEALLIAPAPPVLGSSFAETVWFDRSVIGLASIDFNVTGTSAGWGVSGVTGSGKGPYTVTLQSGGPTDGTVILTLLPNRVIDAGNVTNLGPAAATSGPAVQIDKTAPQATIATPHSPTKSTTVTETVAFNESVTGFTASDLSRSGTATGCVIGSPSAVTSASYVVQITGCGEGTLQLTLAAGSVTDSSSNPGPAVAMSSAVLTIDRTPATAVLTPPSTPNHGPTLNWSLGFSEPVTALTAADFTRTGTATGCAVGAPVSTGATTFSVPVSGCGSGTVTLGLEGQSALDLASNLSPTAAVAGGSVLVDRNIPTTTVPGLSLLRPGATAGSKVPVRIRWTGADVGTGIVRYELSRSTNGGAWVTLTSTLKTPSGTVLATSGSTVRFRVRAVDAAGNVGSWATGPTIAVSLVQQTSRAVHYSGSWATSSSSSYSGGSVRRATTRGASASFTFTGRGIGLVSTLASTRGTVRIYLDGKYVTRVDLRASPTVYRAIVWQTTWSSSHTHTIRLIVDGTAGRPRIDLDAFVVLR